MKNKTSNTTLEGMKTLREATVAAKQLIAAEAAMRAEHGGLLEQRKQIFIGNAWNASESEVTENIERLVTAVAADFADRNSVKFIRSLGGHYRARTGPKEFEMVSPQLPNFGDLVGTLTFLDLCGLAPSLVKARLLEIARTSGKFGSSKAEREAKLRELDASVSEMEETHTRLVEEAATVALTLPLLESVVARRAKEAQAKERADSIAADRAAGRFISDGHYVAANGGV